MDSRFHGNDGLISRLAALMFDLNAKCPIANRGKTPMRITAVDTFTMWGEPRNWVFVKISTDEPELHGWGEATLEGKDATVQHLRLASLPKTSSARTRWRPSASGNHSTRTASGRAAWS